MSEGARYLTAKEVAERYRLTVQWVYGCRSLPRRKVGRYLRFLESDLEDWEKRVESHSRVFGFHNFHPKEVKLRANVNWKEMTHNQIQSGEDHFELLFDISTGE